jgi:uncharacterized lipoprotein
MNKLDLLKIKKALIIATMSTTTLSACSMQPEVKGAKRIEANELFNDRIYIDENGNVILEVKPRKIMLPNGQFKYDIPENEGYAITEDENGRTIGRRVLVPSKKNK